MTLSMLPHNPTEFRSRGFRLGEDYPEICEWWRARRWKGLPVDALPQNGILAFDDAHKYAAIFIWFIESDWAWVDYLVTNPHSPLRRRPEAIEFTIEEAKRVARGAGSRRLITCLNNKNLMAIHSRLGFVRGDHGMTTMICSLEGGTT